MSVKEETVIKPVVHFTDGATILGAGKGKKIAHVYGVLDHPRLGQSAWVTTSYVVSVDDEENPTLIETRNTIYKKA